jgi:geranylgeranyl diphosphate synthase type II
VTTNSSFAGAGAVELVPALLHEYGAVTRDAIARYLPRAAPQRYLYNLLADYPERGGKMMRSTLCLAAARAFGARIEEALPCAVAIELMHNAILIHDDIEDGSLKRRGLPTLHLTHGVPLAINAGDSLSLLSLRPLIDNRRILGPRLAAAVLEQTMTMARETAEGQAMELGWRRENLLNLDDADYLTLVLKKTCWLATIYPASAGALIGTRGRANLEPFIRFGFFLGAAFQIQDDLLNLESEPEYGKERDGDLWEGKRTLVLIRLLSVCSPEEKERIATILRLAREARTEDQIRWIRQLMSHYACLEYAREFARGLAGAAWHEYSPLFSGLADSRDKRFIEALVTWVFERTH